MQERPTTLPGCPAGALRVGHHRPSSTGYLMPYGVSSVLWTAPLGRWTMPGYLVPGSGGWPCSITRNLSHQTPCMLLAVPAIGRGRHGDAGHCWLCSSIDTWQTGSSSGAVLGGLTLHSAIDARHAAGMRRLNPLEWEFPRLLRNITADCTEQMLVLTGGPSEMRWPCGSGQLGGPGPAAPHGTF